MNNRIKNLSVIVSMSALIAGFSIWNVLKYPETYSFSERRTLAQMPELNSQNIVSGDFMDNFEYYVADQFPMRDKIRGIKSFSELYVFQKADVNGLYVKNGHIVKKEDPLNIEMLGYAGDKFRYIYNSFIKDSNSEVYFSIIPEKNLFLSDGKTDAYYKRLSEEMRKRTEYMTYIDIMPLLSADDYYKTDSHWKQESISDVALQIASAMGTDAECSYTENTLSAPFYGVYYGQLGLPFEPDTIKYLTNETINSSVVTSYSKGYPEVTDIYNMEKASGKDPYEMFLSGSEAFITINNPVSKTDRELVIFRDSFGSSFAPLLIESYSKITLIDIRYMQSSVLDSFIEFDDQDVLFLYSSSLLNSSTALR